MQRPHLAIVAPSFDPAGGVGQVAGMQAKALGKHFDVSLISVYGGAESLKYNDIRVPNLQLNWLRRFGHIVREILICRRFSRALIALNKEKPVQLVLYHSHTLASICHRHLPPEAKSALVVHGDIFSRPLGTYDSMMTRLYKKHSLNAYRNTDLTVALSPDMRSKIVGYGISASKIEVIPNGIPARNTLLRRSNSQDSFTVLFVGRLSIEKDPITLVKAIQRCPANIKARIVGGGNLQSALQSEIEVLNLSERITLVGTLSKQQVYDEYDGADLLCVPSISDPLPTVIIEAMASQLPVLGSDVDGIAFMVEDRVTGSLFKPGSVQELAEKITEHASDREWTLSLGRAGGERFAQEFSIDVTGEKLSQALMKQLT